MMSMTFPRINTINSPQNLHMKLLMITRLMKVIDGSGYGDFVSLSAQRIWIFLWLVCKHTLHTNEERLWNPSWLICGDAIESRASTMMRTIKANKLAEFISLKVNEFGYTFWNNNKITLFLYWFYWDWRFWWGKDGEGHWLLVGWHPPQLVGPRSLRLMMRNCGGAHNGGPFSLVTWYNMLFLKWIDLVWVWMGDVERVFSLFFLFYVTASL